MLVCGNCKRKRTKGLIDWVKSVRLPKLCNPKNTPRSGRFATRARTGCLCSRVERQKMHQMTKRAPKILFMGQKAAEIADVCDATRKKGAPTSACMASC